MCETEVSVKTAKLPIVCEDDPVRDLRLVHQREGRALRRTVRRWEPPAADCREHHREVGEHDHRDVECEEVEPKTAEEGMREGTTFVTA